MKCYLWLITELTEEGFLENEQQQKQQQKQQYQIKGASLLAQARTKYQLTINMSYPNTQNLLLKKHHDHRYIY